MQIAPVVFTNSDNLHFAICWGNIYFFVSSDLGSGGCFNHHNIFINTSWWGKRKKKVYILLLSPELSLKETVFHRFKIYVGREYHGVCQNLRCNCQIHDLIIKRSNSAVNTEAKWRKETEHWVWGGYASLYCKHWKQLQWILLSVTPRKSSHLI